MTAGTPSLAKVEGFSKPEFWIWMGVIFGVNAIAAALLGAFAFAAIGAVTGCSALVTAASIARNAVQP